MTSLRNRVGAEKEILSEQASTHWHPEEGTSCNCSQPTAKVKSSASDTGRREESRSFSSAQFSCSVVSDSLQLQTAVRQASLSITNSQSLLKLMSVELMMPSNYLILCHLLLLLPSIFPSIRVFSNEPVLCIRWPKYWSFSISPSNEYSGLISLGLTGLISLQSKGLSKVFSNTTVQKHRFFGTPLSLWSNSHIHTGYWKNHSFD